MKIVVATRNKKKLTELQRILSASGFLSLELVGLDEFPDCPEVEETGKSFEENAVLKASAVAACTGSWAVADDSGLEVDALGGAPGVFSARYAGPGADDKANAKKLLEEMKNVPAGKRTARFRAVIALARPGGDIEKTFSGSIEGTIGTEPKGREGFGYDPVFYPKNQEKMRTFAEITPDEKDALSHRGRALLKLKAYLESI